MEPQILTASYLYPELRFTFSKSGGPGGQHVNKVNTKVTLRFDVPNSLLLNEEQKAKILDKLGSKLTQEGVLVISAQETRSQLANKETVLDKLDALLAVAFKVERKRKPTKPTKASKEKRLEQKKHQSAKKEGRKKW